MKESCDGSQIYTGLHWRAPVVMVSSLLVGTGLAIGHHAFYASLVGTAVSSDPIKVIGWTTNQQQVNIAIGTAFAFVVKASLILASSTAYMQLLFGAINRDNFKLSTLDNWFSGLNDLWSLGCLASYWRFPLLTLVALTCWLLPLAAIVTAASLSVVFDQVHPSPVRSVTVPQPALDSLALSTYYTMDSVPVFLDQRGPNNEVSRIAYAAATAGTILPIDPPGANATWELDFEAPRYACDPPEPELLGDVITNLLAIFDEASLNGTWNSIAPMMFSFLSWSARSNDTSPMPFKKLSDSTEWNIQKDKLPYFQGTGVDQFVSIVPRAELQYVALKAILNLTGGIPEDDRIIAQDKLILMKWYFETATVLRCRAVPTTYRLQFTYSGSQGQHIQVLSTADAVQPELDAHWIYTDVLDDGSLSMDGAKEPRAQNVTSRAWWSMRLGSYSSIQLATMALMLGAANIPHQQGQAIIEPQKGSTWLSQTQVFATILGSTEELQGMGQGLPTAQEITTKDSGLAYDQVESLLPISSARPVGKFKDALEELFFNITVSMASSPMLRYNSSNPHALPPIDVTFNIFGNVYSYGMDKLWLAYGIAVGVTFVNVLIGLWAMVRTGASYTNNFSTAVRVAKNGIIEAEMQERRLPGKDPLPKDLAEAKIRLSKGEAGLLETRRQGSVDSVQHVVGYAPPRMDSLGWK